MNRFVLFKGEDGKSFCVNPAHVVAFGRREEVDGVHTCWLTTLDMNGENHFVVEGTLTQVHGKLEGGWQGGQP